LLELITSNLGNCVKALPLSKLHYQSLVGRPCGCWSIVDRNKLERGVMQLKMLLKRLKQDTIIDCGKLEVIWWKLIF